MTRPAVYYRELLARETALRAACRAGNPVDQANADRLRALRLRAELEPSRGVLPLFDSLDTPKGLEP